MRVGILLALVGVFWPIYIILLYRMIILIIIVQIILLPYMYIIHWPNTITLYVCVCA